MGMLENKTKVSFPLAPHLIIHDNREVEWVNEYLSNPHLCQQPQDDNDEWRTVNGE